MRKTHFKNILKRLSQKLIVGGIAIGSAFGLTGEALSQTQFVPANQQNFSTNQNFQAPAAQATNQGTNPQFTSPNNQSQTQQPRIQPLTTNSLNQNRINTADTSRIQNSQNTPVFKEAGPQFSETKATFGESSEAVFQSYSLNNANSTTVGKQIKTQLGNLVEIVNDTTNNRLVIKTTPNNHRLIAQVIGRLDNTQQHKVEASNIKSIRSFNVATDVIRSAANELSQLYVDKDRIIVAADETVGKLMLFSTERDYEEVAAYLKRKGFLDKKGTAKIGQSGVLNHQLKHISWRDLEQSIYRGWGNAMKIEVSTDGAFSRFHIPTLNQSRSTIQIDRRNNEVQIEADKTQLSPITRLVALLDQPADNQRVSIIKTRPDAIDQVQSTVSMYKFAALQQEVQPRTTSAIIGKSKIKNGVYAIYQDQENANNADNGNNANTPQDDSLGPIGRVEIITIPGTDIIILKGDPKDVERVRKLIEQIEKTSEEYKPQIEVLPLKHVDNIAVQVIASEVYTTFYAPSLGETSITALVKPNALLLVGTPQGVTQARELIEKLDVEVQAQTEFKVFRIKHMSAVDLENRLRSFYLGQSTQGFGANVGGGGGQNAQTQGIAGDGLATRMRLASDYRSNALFVHASPRDMVEITKFITEIDVESAPDGAVDHLKIIRLKNSTAAELAPVLQDILTGQLQGAGQSTQGNNQFNNQLNNLNNQQFSQVRSAMLTLQSLDPSGKIVKSSILFDTRITADENSNSLIIKAPKDSIPLIELLVQQLDQLPDVESRIKVFELDNASAPQVVETIQNLFETQQGGGGGAGGGAGGTNILPLETGGYQSTIVSLRMAADARSNTVIAAGSQGDLNIIEALITRLDEDIDSNYVHKVYRLQNVTADIVAEALTGWLEGRSETLGTDPRIVGSGDGSLEAVKRAITVQSETETNSLIVSAHREYLDIIENIIRDLDFKKQVVIQAVIADITLTNNFELGVQWGVQDSLLFDRGLGNPVGTDAVGFPFVTNPLGNTVTAANGLDLRETLAGQALSSLNVGRSSTNAGYAGLVLSAGNESINVLLRALDARSKVDILSRPQITTLENIQAFVQVGQDLPYITGVDNSNNAAGTTTFATDFLELGVTLSVTPRVRPDGEIWLRVDVGNTDVAEGAGVVVQTSANGGEVRQPIINVQTMQTDVVARSGQTVVLGGLIRTDKDEFTNGVPFFSNIPLIGRLFRFDSTSVERKELFVVLRPIVIDSPEDRDALLQIESNRMNWVLGDVNELHGPLFEDEVLAGDIDTVYPDRTPTGYHQEADADNKKEPADVRTGSLAPLNGDLSRNQNIQGRFNQMPLPNERHIGVGAVQNNGDSSQVQQSSYQQTVKPKKNNFFNFGKK